MSMFHHSQWIPELYTKDESPLSGIELDQYNWLLSNGFKAVNDCVTDLHKRRFLLSIVYTKKQFNNFEPTRDLEFEKLQEYYKSQK